MAFTRAHGLTLNCGVLEKTVVITQHCRREPSSRYLLRALLDRFSIAPETFKFEEAAAIGRVILVALQLRPAGRPFLEPRKMILPPVPAGAVNFGARWYA